MSIIRQGVKSTVNGPSPLTGACDDLGNTPLHLVFMQTAGQSHSQLDFNESGITPSMQSANLSASSPSIIGDPVTLISIARMLIKHGAEVNARNKNMYTPLHLAV
jgi:ankyrin repeat protein